MSFEITVNIVGLAELTAAIGKLGNAPRQPEAPKADPALIAKPNPVADQLASESVSSKTTEVSASDTSKAQPSDEPFDEAKVPILAQKLNQVKGRDVLIATLAEFGAKNISGIAADKKAAFVARCEELIG